MKKKVLFVVESLAGGGAEKILCNIIRNLDREKYHVTLFVLVKTGCYVNTLENYCTMIYALPDYAHLKNNPWKKLLYKIQYKRLYNSSGAEICNKYIKEVFDVEIAFIEGMATKIVASSKNEKSKKYAWIHTDMIVNTDADSLYDSYEEHRRAYLTYNKIVAVSSSVADSFKGKYQIEKNVNVIYNPVDSAEIISLAQGEKPSEKGEKLELVSVGRLEHAKGYDRLLSVVSRLNQEGYGFQIKILGEGSKRKELEDYVRENDLSKCVCFLGFQENPYPYIANADVFVCSSRAEGFSTVATEALILNTPIITTDCAGMKELFGNCNCGMIVQNEEEALYQGLKEVLDHPEMLAAFQDEEKKRAENFSIKCRMKIIEGLLDE